MALIKSKTLQSGESGDYWRVSQLTFQRVGMRVNVILSLYKSAELAAAGAVSLPVNHSFNFTITQPEIVSGNIVGIAYTKIKSIIETQVHSIDGSGDMVYRYPDLVGATDSL